MKALIVDGEELLRLSLREVILVAGNFREVVQASSEHEFLARTANHDDLSLIVVHPASIGEEGHDCMKLIRRLYPDAAVVTILDHGSQHSGECDGAVTVARNASVAEMVTTIRRALKLPLDGFGAVSSRPAAPDVRGVLQEQEASYRQYSPRETTADRVDLGRLSYRQKQILAMAADGLPNKEIAARLSIAEGTVKAHMHAIFKVLGVSNRTQAVIRYGAVSRAPDTAMVKEGSSRSSGWAYAPAN